MRQYYYYTHNNNYTTTTTTTTTTTNTTTTTKQNEERGKVFYPASKKVHRLFFEYLSDKSARFFYIFDTHVLYN